MIHKQSGKYSCYATARAFHLCISLTHKKSVYRQYAGVTIREKNIPVSMLNALHIFRSDWQTLGRRNIEGHKKVMSRFYINTLDKKVLL